MFAEQGNNRNRIKSICFYSLLTSVCIIFGFVETLIPSSLIAPGVKLGLANSVALILIIKGDIKGAVLVNLARICLSCLLFGSPISLIYSIAGGAVSMLICIALSKLKSISAIGISIAGGVSHNITQTAVAFFILRVGVLYYLPMLIVSGMVSGVVIGMISMIISKKLKTNNVV